jgi:hypothetical protein
MSRPVISEVDIARANGLLVKFGEKFEHVFGKKYVTPNMHLRSHLKECVTDFGPDQLHYYNRNNNSIQ